MRIYERPRDLETALELLGEGDWQVMAGGTDIYPARVGRPLTRPILDVTAIEELRRFEEDGESFLLGAGLPWGELRDRPLPPFLEALGEAAATIGGRQIQNRATVGGNLCNASPAADGAAVLMALEALVELRSLRGRRRLPLTEFVLGNRRTALAADELLTAVIVPKPRGGGRSTFLKLGARAYLVISIAMVAILLDCDADGRILHAGVAVGACAPTARRLPLLESRLIGRSLGDPLTAAVDATVLAPLAPIDDIRGTAAYRRHAVLVLLRRALEKLARPLPGGGRWW